MAYNRFYGGNDENRYDYITSSDDDYDDDDYNNDDDDDDFERRI